MQIYPKWCFAKVMTFLNMAFQLKVKAQIYINLKFHMHAFLGQWPNGPNQNLAFVQKKTSCLDQTQTHPWDSIACQLETVYTTITFPKV